MQICRVVRTPTGDASDAHRQQSELSEAVRNRNGHPHSPEERQARELSENLIRQHGPARMGSGVGHS